MIRFISSKLGCIVLTSRMQCEIVEVLSSAGVCFDTPDLQGITPLHLAAIGEFFPSALHADPADMNHMFDG